MVALEAKFVKLENDEQSWGRWSSSFNLGVARQRPELAFPEDGMKSHNEGWVSAGSVMGSCLFVPVDWGGRI